MEKRVMVSMSELMAGLARESVRISPYDVPENLEVVLRKFADAVRGRFEEVLPEFRVVELTRGELELLVKETLFAIPEFRRWNLTRWEMAQGYSDPEDEGRPVKFGAVAARWGNPPPDYDFVDLDAHVRNTVHAVWHDALEDEGVAGGQRNLSNETCGGLSDPGDGSQKSPDSGLSGLADPPRGSA